MPDLPFFPGIRQTILHQRLPVPFPFAAAGNPQAVQIIIIVADDGNPGGFQGSIFNKNCSLLIQLSKDMALLQPAAKPLPLGVNARMELLAADNAA